jgi:hypothetical protein
LESYSELMRVCDNLFSILCRAQMDHCEKCGVPLAVGAGQWSHHFTRAVKHIRYLDENWSLHCAGCNLRERTQGPEWWEWVEGKLGAERFALLRLAKASRGSLRRSDLELQILAVQKRIDDLPEGERREWALMRRDVVLRRATI